MSSTVGAEGNEATSYGLRMAATTTGVLVRVLFGEVEPAGRLPVSVPGPDGTGELFELGHGLGY